MASKVQERIFVEGFLPHLSPSHVIIEERESPDFLVSDGHGQCGLEVVQVFRDQGLGGSPSKATESRRAQYLRRLASKYYGASGLPLLVKAHIPDRFDGALGIVADRLRVSRLAEPWARSRFEVTSATFHLTSLPTEAGLYARWMCINNSVGWSGWLTADDIVPVIAEKASKLSHYRCANDRVELLLVVDATHNSGMLRWRGGDRHPLAQGFDAVYLYFHPGKSMRLA